jgi:hypothetical protein
MSEGRALVASDEEEDDFISSSDMKMFWSGTAQVKTSFACV